MDITITLFSTTVITTLALPLSMMGKTPAIIAAGTTVGTFDDRPAEAHEASPVGPSNRIGILGYNPPDSTGDRDMELMGDDAGRRPYAGRTEDVDAGRSRHRGRQIDD